MSLFQTVFIYILLLSEINFLLAVNDSVKNTVLAGSGKNTDNSLSIRGTNGENTTAPVPKPNNIDTETLCTRDMCIMKCCPFGKFFNTKLYINPNTGEHKSAKFCDKYDTASNISEVDNLDEKLNNVFITKPKLSNFEMKAGIYKLNSTFRSKTVKYAALSSYNFYLNEQAEVVVENPNSYHRWTYVRNGFYCLELENEGNASFIILKPEIKIVFKEPEKESTRTSTKLMTLAMLVSSFFLMLVLVVYVLLPELRTQGGIILMTYVACLLPSFLLLAAMRIQSENKPAVCVTLTYLIYFFFLASFTWMNVMSFDIWWTFRCLAKVIPLHIKFSWYSFYGWGLPLTLTIAMAIVNSIDMRQWPWFVTPKIPSDSCFIKGGEKFLYLYMPMLILNLINWILFIMTAFNLWRLTRQTAMLDSAGNGNSRSNRKQRHRFMIYLKLSILMGLNFVLEVVSYKYPNSSLWFISDFYNILVGLTIFLIFVCKPKVLRKLKKRLSQSKSTWYPDQGTNTNTATTTSDSSSTPTQEMKTLQFSSNPKGR